MTREPDNFSELENALRNLPLRQPSAGLDARVRSALAPHTRHRWILSLGGAALAAAAALLLMFWLGTPSDTKSTASSATLPSAPVQVATATATANEQWRDEGIVGYASDGPVRQYRIVGQLASASGGQTRTIEEVIEVVSQAY